METLKELERRKKELELRGDIKRLERQERFGSFLSNFDPALLWAVPLIAFVSFMAFLIIDSSGVKSLPSAILGVVIAISLLAIFRWVRGRS